MIDFTKEREVSRTEAIGLLEAHYAGKIALAKDEAIKLMMRFELSVCLALLQFMRATEVHNISSENMLRMVGAAAARASMQAVSSSDTPDMRTYLARTFKTDTSADAYAISAGALIQHAFQANLAKCTEAYSSGHSVLVRPEGA